MKRNDILLLGLLIALVAILLTAGCNNEEMGPVDDGPALTGRSISYDMVSASNSGVSGNVVFAETASGSTLITFSITGGSAGIMHPVHIHENSAAVGGGVVISLGEIDGSTGMHAIEVTATNDGMPVSYDDLLIFDGHINIHESPENIANLIAQADIGGNELTGEHEDFDLFGIINSEVKGEANIFERKSGKTLVVINLENDISGDAHPAHIHANTAVEGGPIVISLNPVDAITKISLTDITARDDDTPISYNEMKDFDGYINVHLSSGALGTLVVQGDFGQNKLTSEEEIYDLNENSGSGISGNVTFTKRRNNETLITILLDGTVQDDMHPAHIHANSTTEGGSILLDLSDVNGETGLSKTQVASLNDGSPVTYDDLVQLNGHINVHLSKENLASIIARGNIGINVQ